jgi:hypothetical protein
VVLERVREELERREGPAAADADGPAETADIAGAAWNGVDAARDGVAAAAADSPDGARTGAIPHTSQ